MQKNSITTDFGFQQVSWKDKQIKVNNVFHSVANKYDLMNDLMSFGIHRIWKQIAIFHASVRKGQIVLDLAGGTGDLTSLLSSVVGELGLVVLSDINKSMLNLGKKKLVNQGRVGNIQYVQANAECLPFNTNSFDCVLMGFGLRNITDKSAALYSIYKILKPGSKVVILEFSKPLLPLLNQLYNKYSFTVLPLLGKVVANDAQSYHYLAESISRHPNQEVLKNMMLRVGFNKVIYYNLTAGIVALHLGYKY